MAFRRLQGDLRLAAPMRVQRRTRRFRFRRRTGGVRRRRQTFAMRNPRSGGFIGTELKFIRTQSVADAFTTAWANMEDGTMLCLNGIAQGDGEEERIGRIAWIHSIHIKGLIFDVGRDNQAAPINDYSVRLALVLDTQTNAAVPTPSDVFDILQSQDLLAFRNLQHTHRFKVLWDRIFVISKTNVGQGAITLFGSSGDSRIFSVNKVFKPPLKVQFKLGTPVIGAITDNSLHLMGIATSTADTPQVTYQVRLRFKS